MMTNLDNQRLPTEWKEARTALLNESSLTSRPLAEALSAQSDTWFQEVGRALPAGWALVATAGYAEGTLCPGSDLDVMLIHPHREPDSSVNAIAREIWYPFWDAGMNISPAVHSPDTALKLAATDLTTATTLLRVRLLAGSPEPARQLAQRASSQWQKGSRKWIVELHAAVRERHQKAGEAAFLLEPDLKESRGAVRDVQAIEWALHTNVEGIADGLVCNLTELRCHAQPIIDARIELHRATRRASNVLRLQDQDEVAERLGMTDADELMSLISESARTIAWLSDRFWDLVERSQKKIGRNSTKQLVVGSGLAISAGALRVTDRTQLITQGDRGRILRVAATAARHSVLPDPATLHWLSSLAEQPCTEDAEGRWTQPERDDMLALLDSGQPLIAVVEALDHYRLFERVLPEWHDVRSRPQRNSYHTFTVDRHLLECVVRARALVRTVHRPDLLLLSALLHDIGKNGAADHVTEGVVITQRIGERMSLPDADIATVSKLVESHLLLSEVATRRDVADPGTGEYVARALGDRETLELLRALTEADSLATGPAAWSSWKAILVDDLIATTAHVMGGQRALAAHPESEERRLKLAAKVPTDGFYLETSEHTCTVATADRRGLFAMLAGVMAAHGIEVLAASASTTSTHMAIDEFRITRRTGGLPDWPKVQSDLQLALNGSLDIEARIEQRAATYRTAPAYTVDLPDACVIIDNETSPTATILEVRAPDSPALLFRLARLIAAFELDISRAKVATLGLEVVDVFYLQKIVNGKSVKPDLVTATTVQTAIANLLAPTTN